MLRLVILRSRFAVASFRTWGGYLLLVSMASLLVGCGQVITITESTATPIPTATIAMVAVATVASLPTETPAPYTPEPTPTQTVTPTPIFYEIQQGDSLLTVANQFEVSVADLQEANGILDARSLQIGQELIIPSQEEVLAQIQLTPTATPLPIQIQNVYFNETTIGGLWVLGEVYNDKAVPLEQIRVGVTLLDENDREISASNSLVALDLVDVGERAPFSILFGETPENFENYQIFPISAVDAYVGSYYRDLEVVRLRSEGERYSSYTVSGSVQNVGPEEAVDVQVVLTAYDSLERVIAMRKIVPDHNVVPRGGETFFTAVLVPVGGPVARVAAVAQGRRLSSIDEQ